MRNGICFATEKDIPALCEIWKICFSDSEDYIKLFYSENFKYIDVLIYAVDGKPVSMLHLFKSAFADGEKENNAIFLYAGGTLPEHRSNGYFIKLLNKAKHIAEQKGCALFFKPATISLCNFYETLGFQIDSYFHLVTVSPADIVPLSVEDISFQEYNRMRNSAFSDIPFAKWDDRHICWCVKDNKFFSGRTLKFEFDGKEHFFMAYSQENTLIINETDLNLTQLKKLSGALCNLFGTVLIKAYMPDSCAEGEEIISSIVYNTPLHNAYVNQILI